MRSTNLKWRGAVGQPGWETFLPELLQRCLAKKASRRFSNAMELTDAVVQSPLLRSGDERQRPLQRLTDVDRSWIGKILNDRYELQEWLAPGRFGSNLFRATDQRTSGDVAVRLWDLGQRCDQRPTAEVIVSLCELLQLKVKGLQVRNPGLITVFDLVSTDDCVYIVTELVGG